MTFPVSPTNGQTAVVNNITYQFTSASNSWRRVLSQVTATNNVLGGAANQIVYQTGTSQTGFIVAPTTASTYLQWTGSAFAWASVAGFNGGTITNALTINSSTQATSTNTGALQVINGGAGIGGNLYVGGNGIFGSALNFTPANANLQYGGNRQGFLQLAVQNANADTTSTTDIVAFTNNGNDDGGYIDFGITSNAYNDPVYNLSSAGDGFLYVVGTGTAVGKLIISTYQPQDIIFSTGGGATQHELGRWKHATGLQVTTSTTATSTTTGALQVTGGAGIRGDLYVGGRMFGELKKITVGTVAPTSPAVNDVWIDTN